MSRDKSVWFAEEILLDAKLINSQLEAGEWAAVGEMLRAEAQLTRDALTQRLRPKKASEYTLRLIAEVLHLSNMEQPASNPQTLGVAEQCLRLIRSCAASGTKMQTYITKDLTILESMHSIATEYQHASSEFVTRDILDVYESCMVILMQTLGNLVVNNPFNQIIVWDKFESVILRSLVEPNDRIASAAAMIVYNILLGQPNVLPDDVSLLNSIAYMYNNVSSEFPHLIIEYLIGVENTYLEKLYGRLEPDARMLILELAYNLLMSNESQDINVSVNFIRFMSQEFKSKSDNILKTVDKDVCGMEPREVVYLLDIIAVASSMDAYMDCLQADMSLFINCAFLLRAVHKLGKESDNFFSSINKLHAPVGRKLVPPSVPEPIPNEGVKKNESNDMLAGALETQSECTESESSEQFFECQEQPLIEQGDSNNLKIMNQRNLSERPNSLPRSQPPQSESTDASEVHTEDADKFTANVILNTDSTVSDDPEVVCVSCITDDKSPVSELSSRKVSLEHKIDIDICEEPPLIIDSSPEAGQTLALIHPTTEILNVLPSEKSVTEESAVVEESAEDKTNNVKPVAEGENVGTPESISPEKETCIEVCSNPEEVEDSPAANDVVSPGDSQEKGLDSGEVTDAVHSSNEQSPPLTETDTKNSPDVAKEVKKSQNVSTEFDLSEQLQKILGITTEKTSRPDNQDKPTETKDSKPQKEVKIAEPCQSKVPTVKIVSPERAPPVAGAGGGPRTVDTQVLSAEQHVAFGLKATLVRVLSNMCWKNQINKRQIRELEVIPVLLDCCNIDARNPLIMQWVIFAIRNLCENSPENQALIASLTIQGPVTSETLQEFGLTLNVDAQGNKIQLAPLIRK